MGGVKFRVILLSGYTDKASQRPGMFGFSDLSAFCLVLLLGHGRLVIRFRPCPECLFGTGQTGRRIGLCVNRLNQPIDLIREVDNRSWSTALHAEGEQRT